MPSTCLCASVSGWLSAWLSVRPSVSLRRRLAVALHRPLARAASRLALFAAHAENRAAPQRQVPDDVIGHVTGRLRAITTTTTTERHWSTSRCPSF